MDINNSTLSRSDCPCDTTFPWDGPCIANWCMAYHTGTVIAFSLLLLYTIAVLISSFFGSTGIKSPTEVRKLILYLLILAEMLRIARYGYLMTKPILSSDVLLVMRGLYTIPLFIAFCAYMTLIFCWIKIYHDVLQGNQSLGSARSGVLGRWLKWYVVVCVTVGILYIATTFADMLLNVQLLVTFYNGIILIFFNLSFIIYGRRLWKSSQESFNDSTNEAKVIMFKKYNRFTWMVSIWFLIGVVVILILGSIALKDLSLPYFLFRQSIYRIVEVIPVYLIVATFEPPSWSICEIYKKTKARSNSMDPTDLSASTPHNASFANDEEVDLPRLSDDIDEKSSSSLSE